LRVAVADTAGALGALDIPVDAVLNEMGPLAASDLMTAWVDATGQPHLFALEDLPSTATSLQALLELYAPAGGASGLLDAMKNDVQVEITLTKIGATDPVDERSVVPQMSSGVLRAIAEFPTDDLSPGTYRLRARVETGGKVVGTAIATITKRMQEHRGDSSVQDLPNHCGVCGQLRRRRSDVLLAERARLADAAAINEQQHEVIQRIELAGVE
jgi:hypothetical protein